MPIGFQGGLIARPAMAATTASRQFHNQAASSPLHRRLVEMWATIGAETNGRVAAEVFAENAVIAGSDPAALKMLISGELDFFTLMGGILGQAVPVAEVQQVPFAFRTAAEAHAAADGALGAYLREEMAAKGIHGFPVGAFDNGMRQTSSTQRPIAAPEGFRRPQDPPAGGPDVHRYLPGAGRRTGHHQRQRHL